MRLAEIARSRWILGTAAGLLVGLVALRAPARTVAPAPPVLDVPDHHELTMQLHDDTDCASDVVTQDDGKVLVTLRIPDPTHCSTQVRVYHLDNDRLVFERRD
jgi:hypothetical protein